jgi:sugar lactone lactonase YvrE
MPRSPRFARSFLRFLPAAAAAFLAACGGSGGDASLSPGSGGSNQHLYVANAGNNSVTVYSTDASGNATPTATITSSALSIPAGVAVDGSGDIFVSNYGTQTITEFSAGANGSNISPSRTISGSFSKIAGIAVDTAGTLYVADGATVWQVTGTATNVLFSVPVQPTVPNAPALAGITVDASGNVYVADGANDVVYHGFASGGTGQPVDYIAGNMTGLLSPVGVALDSQGNILVANYGSSAASTDASVTVYAANSSQNATPVLRLTGSNTGFAQIAGIALDSGGSLYVANAGSNTISVFAPGSSGNAAPATTISGSSTGLNRPIGIAVGP